MLHHFPVEMLTVWEPSAEGKAQDEGDWEDFKGKFEFIKWKPSDQD